MTSDDVVVGLFERDANVREVLDAARALGLSDQQFGIVRPGQSLSPSKSNSPDASNLLSAATTAESSDLAEVLRNMGVAEGEARFYASEARAGRTLLVVNASGKAEQVRRLVLEHGGYDVQSRGGEFIRGDGAGAPSGARPRPIDVTANWVDFRSRYEMLWQQHYGTTDATWQQMEPLYEWAWQLANDARFRGRPWQSVEGALREEWMASRFSSGMRWEDASGPMRDVWEDVAQEALTGAEGGADRRIPTSGTDQSIAARDVVPRERDVA